MRLDEKRRRELKRRRHGTARPRLAEISTFMHDDGRETLIAGRSRTLRRRRLRELIAIELSSRTNARPVRAEAPADVRSRKVAASGAAAFWAMPSFLLHAMLGGVRRRRAAG